MWITARASVCVTSACLALAACWLGAASVGAQEVDEKDIAAPRVRDTLELTCTPDAKSKKAGAEAFDDTVTLKDDRVRSKALKAKGFADALAIPKFVNGVLTVQVSFAKTGGGKATYFIRVKKDGAINGSLTIKDGKDQQRYVVTARGVAPSDEAVAADAPAAGKQGKSRSKNAPGGAGKAGAKAADPAVLRVDGGFVRLMTVQIAMAEAGVSDKVVKSKISEILKLAGTEQMNLRTAHLTGKLTAAEYAEVAGERLKESNAALATLLGDKAAEVEAAYDKPMTAEFLYHNALRAALAELASDKARAADKVVHQRLVDLALLIRKPAGRESAALATFRGETDAQVEKSLPAAQWARVQKTVAGLTSYTPDAGDESPTVTE